MGRSTAVSSLVANMRSTSSSSTTPHRRCSASTQGEPILLLELLFRDRQGDRLQEEGIVKGNEEQSHREARSVMSPLLQDIAVPHPVGISIDGRWTSSKVQGGEDRRHVCELALLELIHHLTRIGHLGAYHQLFPDLQANLQDDGCSFPDAKYQKKPQVRVN